MGRRTFSREVYTKSVSRLTPKEGPVTARAERQARVTGKLNPLVDPQGFGVIRRSLPRFEQQTGGLWLLTVGTPMSKETRVDTTGSMGGNVDIALRVLPQSYELCSGVLTGYDLQIATGIFGDVIDQFVLCRPQFEMEADKIVQQLTLMVPERGGGDEPEDPHYGLFGAAYLTDRWLNRIGLLGYDFTVSDATAHDALDERTLRRVFGDEVFDKVAENGHQITQRSLPTLEELVRDLLKQAHAFFLQVGDHPHTTTFWTRIFGPDRVVVLPDTELLPHVESVIIGLTEGTLDLRSIPGYLETHNVDGKAAERIVRSVSNIPIGAQASRPNFSKRPKAGDLFKEKTDLWPVDHQDVVATGDAGPAVNWL